MPYGFTYEFNFKIPEYIPPTEKEMKNSKLVLRATGLPGFRFPQRGPFYPAPLILNRMLQLFDNGRFVGGTATLHEINFANFGATTIYSPKKLASIANNFMHRRKCGVNPDGSLYTKINRVVTGEYPKFDISVLRGLRYPIAFVTLDSFNSLNIVAKQGRPLTSVNGTVKGFLVVHKNAFNEGACIIRKYTSDLKNFFIYPIVTRMDERYSIGVYDDYVLPIKDLVFSLPIYIHTSNDMARIQGNSSAIANDFAHEVIFAHNAALPRC